MLSFIEFLSEAAMHSFNKLSAAELLKPGREGRADNIIRKITDKDPFLMMTGGLMILKNDAALSQFITARNAEDKRQWIL